MTPQNPPPVVPQEQAAAESAFRQLADAIFRSYCDFYPSFSVDLGLHAYDGHLGDFRDTCLQDRISCVARHLRQLEAIDPALLPDDLAHDHAVAKSGLARELWVLTDQDAFRTSPLTYLRLVDPTRYLKRPYAPLNVRLAALVAHLGSIPRVLAAADSTLATVLPRPALTTSIESFRGLARYISDDLGFPADHERLQPRLRGARAAALDGIRAFTLALEGRLPAATDNVALGYESYSRLLRTDLLHISPMRLLQIAHGELMLQAQALRELAERLSPRTALSDLLQRMRNDHPSAASLVDATAHLVEEVRADMIARDLVTVPAELHCRTRATPAFMRWGFAFLDAPGPFEPAEPLDAYFYVTPPDASWSPTKQSEWLRRFSYPVLRNTVVHEAYPGHYVQQIHFNRCRSALRALFVTSTFTEGWAHYSEQLMTEGLDGVHGGLLRLAQIQDAAVRTCRCLVSVKLHTDGMTLDEAARLFTTTACCEPVQAHYEAVRGTFDPGYFSYFLGRLLLCRVREDYVRLHGMDRDSRRAFHDLLLSYGAPPIPLVRRMLGLRGEAI